MGETAGEAEAQPAIALKDPIQPTEEMVKAHEVSHLPFRAWCAACVRGRGKSDPHRSKPENQPAALFPAVSMDYVADHALPILVLTDRQSKSVWAHAVPSKGIGHPYPVAAVVADLRRTG